MATIVTETLRKDPEGISIAYHKSDKLLKKHTHTHHKNGFKKTTE